MLVERASFGRGGRIVWKVVGVWLLVHARVPLPKDFRTAHWASELASAGPSPRTVAALTIGARGQPSAANSAATLFANSCLISGSATVLQNRASNTRACSRDLRRPSL